MAWSMACMVKARKAMNNGMMMNLLNFMVEGICWLD